MSKGLGAAQRTMFLLFAGLSFASAFGLSTWVAVGFAMVMLAWLVWVLWWEPESRGRVPVLLCAECSLRLRLYPISGVSPGKLGCTDRGPEHAGRGQESPAALRACCVLAFAT